MATETPSHDEHHPVTEIQTPSGRSLDAPSSESLPTVVKYQRMHRVSSRLSTGLETPATIARDEGVSLHTIRDDIRTIKEQTVAAGLADIDVPDGPLARLSERGREVDLRLRRLMTPYERIIVETYDAERHAQTDKAALDARVRREGVRQTPEYAGLREALHRLYAGKPVISKRKSS